jgi:hypothetical protein
MLLLLRAQVCHVSNDLLEETTIRVLTHGSQHLVIAHVWLLLAELEGFP